MSGYIASLLRQIAAAERTNSFAVRRIAEGSGYFAGRDAAGCAALLVKSSSGGQGVPLRLAGIEARFSVSCKIAELGLSESIETFTVILCLSRDLSVEAYFSSILESLVSLLGPEPTTEEISEAVDQLVELFQKLQRPARRSLTGLVGEVSIILFAADANAAIAAWRVDPDERFDFVTGDLRLDVKASSVRRRSHEITFEQVNAFGGTCMLFASIWIESAGGGCSLSELIVMIEKRLVGNSAAASKLRMVIADTLGDTLPSAMSWSFDLPLAKSSLQFFAASGIPALRPPLPSGISGVRFVSDFTASQPSDLTELRLSLGSQTSALLPA